MRSLFVITLCLFCVTASAQEIKVRLISIKHSKEQMAESDVNLALRAVKVASDKGLKIKSIGNEYVDKDGVMRVTLNDFESDLDRFRQYVSEQMKINAEPGDTVILFTIGHGFPSGVMDRLGKRADVMKAIAAAAEENRQRTLWWQLSCYATAGLPSVDTLTESQRAILSILASSVAQQQSASGVEGKIMERVFLALAGDSESIDPDKNHMITATELKKFLDSGSPKRGHLFFAADPSQVIFGENADLANQIPIKDRNNPQGNYPKNYIPKPQ